MYKAIIIASLVTCVLGDAIPDFVKPGKCAKVNNQDKFDLRQYSGRWYWTHMIENSYQPANRCIHSNYEYSDVEYGFNVKTAGFTPADEHVQMDGRIYPTKEFPAAHMLLDFPTVFASPYEVVETDYKNYACIYSCVETNGFKAEFGFVFSRSPNSDGPAGEKCAAVFEKNGVSFTSFNKIPHTAECVYRA